MWHNRVPNTAVRGRNTQTLQSRRYVPVRRSWFCNISERRTPRCSLSLPVCCNPAAAEWMCVPLSAPESVIVFQGERQIKRGQLAWVKTERYCTSPRLLYEIIVKGDKLSPSFSAQCSLSLQTLISQKSKTLKSIVLWIQYRKYYQSLQTSKDRSFLSSRFLFSYLQGWRSREHWWPAAAGRGCWRTGFQVWAWWPRYGDTAWCPRCCRPETGSCRHHCRAEQGWELVEDWE